MTEASDGFRELSKAGVRCSNKLSIFHKILIQEAQLMLTNLRDAFGGQSRSPNIVPFHMLGVDTVDSYCAIVTSSLFDFKKCRDLEMGSKVTQGH